MKKRFYITTAIDYANGQPHLGHAYEKVIADVIARARRCLGEEVFYLTGLDEHGQKVQQAALAEGKTPQAYCDEIAARWNRFTEKLGLSNDDFVRTTEPRHKAVVQTILSRLHEAGQFYRKTYKGFYSPSAETFLTEKDRLPDGTFDASWGNVIELEEDNYYFRLREHQAWLIAHIEANPDFITPEYRRNEVLGFLRTEELEDLCISRPAARLSWGIPIPFDPAYVTYVWFDALVNYISAPFGHGDPVVRDALGREVGREVLVQTVEQALLAAAKEVVGPARGLRCVIDPKSGNIKAFAKLQVSERVFSAHEQISLEDAQKLKPDAQLGEELEADVTPAGFGRIAAQHAKQALMERIRQAEDRLAIVTQPAPRAGDLQAWPADVHLIGKDILKFHAVFWPIMLKAMGLALPRQILTHGWWQKEGKKLSKSTGNVVDPIAVIDEWGVDAFRYYMVRELDIGPDGNWTDAGFRSRYQAELANGLGNLVNRSLSMIKRYRNGAVPAGENKLADAINACRERTVAAYRAYRLQEALLEIGALITKANQYIDQTSPFKIAKDPERAADLDHILYTLAEVCRALGALLWPVIPGAAEKIQAQLGFAPAAPALAAAPEPIAPGHAIGEVFALFPRKDEKK